MSRTQFIVVSGKRETDDIARKIVEEYVPRTPAAGVMASYGRILGNGEGYAFDIRGANTEEDEDLERGMANHIAQFMSTAGVSAATANVNLFFLDNPYGENDFDQSSFKRLIALRNDPKIGFGALTVWHVVLGYDTARPDDVTTMTADEALAHILDGQDTPTHTLYVGTRNIRGGASFSDEEHHAFHLPRMLADFMLLASDPATSGIVVSAALPSIVGTSVFSIGQSECMYYAPDVERMQSLAMERALMNVRLESETPMASDDPLDISANPTGLRRRMESLAPKYKRPDYSTQASGDNITAKVDAVIKERITPLMGGDCPLGDAPLTFDTVQKACEAAEKAKRNESQRRQTETKETFETMKRTYGKLVRDAKSDDFCQWVKAEREKAEAMKKKCDADVAALMAEKEGRGLIKRIIEWIFGTSSKRNTKTRSLQEQSENLTKKIAECDAALKASEEILVLTEKGEKYSMLEAEVARLESERRRIDAELVSCDLTSFRDTFNIVDRDKAIAHFTGKAAEYMRAIETEYARLLGTGKNMLGTAYENVKQQEAGAYATVDWAKPFDFISVPNMGALYCQMEAQSLPYVNVNEKAMGFFSKRQIMIFANSSAYAQPNLPEMNSVYQALQTFALTDKICAIQIVALNGEYVKSLTGQDAEAEKPEVEEVAETYIKQIGDNKDETSEKQNIDDTLKDTPEISTSQTQMLGNGYRLLRDVKFGEAKRYFATVEKNSYMADICTALINSKKLIDEIAKGAEGEMTEEQKRTISKIVALFSEYGISYAPLRHVADTYL